MCKKAASAHQRKNAGKRMTAIDNALKALDGAVFVTKYFIIPIETWRHSENAWLRIAAILFAAICAVKDSRKKK